MLSNTSPLHDGKKGKVKGGGEKKEEKRGSQKLIFLRQILPVLISLV